jgi:hypothetical protein
MKMLNNTNDHVFGYVLEVLPTGLYPNNLDIIREYVQNGYDAIHSLRELGVRGSEEIHINIEGNSITIHDTGIGMDRDTVEKYRYFGYSEKITTKSTGFRGIGKLAGLSVARDLEVVTTKYNIPYQYRVKFLASKMLNKVIEGKKIGINYPLNELINDHTIIEEFPEDPITHYTKVILHNIKEDANDLLSNETLMSHIGQVMPVDFDDNKFKLGKIIQDKLLSNVNSYRTVEIFLNGQKVLKPYSDSDGLSGLTFHEILSDNGDDIVAFAWVMKNGSNSKAIINGQVKNIRAIYKGFMIGSSDILTSVLFSSGRQFLSGWFAGEVYIMDEELIPTSARDNFESNGARQILFKNLREQLGKVLDRTANQTSKVNSITKELEKTKKVIQNIQSVTPEEFPKDAIIQKKKEIQETTKKLERKLEQNKSALSNELRKNVVKIIEDLNQEKTKIEEMESNQNINTEVNFSPKEKQVYEMMVSSIKTFFKKEGLTNEEELISHAYKKLIKVFGTKSTSN